MKKFIAIVMLAIATSACAHGGGHYQPRHSHHHHHNNNIWIAPVVGAVAGAIVYNAMQPAPQPVYVQPAPPVPNPYYCQQYYCPVQNCTQVPLYSYDGRILSYRQYCQ